MIELNINMGLSGLAPNAKFLTERFITIKHLLQSNTDFAVFRCGYTQRAYPDGLVHHVFVAEVDFDFTKENKHFLASLSDVLGQDCIAAYLPDVCAGMLIGPKAHLWGEFQATEFITVDEVLA